MSAVSRALSGFRFDVFAAVLGLLIALAMFPLRFLANQIYIETIPLVLGGACIFYLASVYGSNTHDPTARTRDFDRRVPTFSRTTAAALPPIALFGMAAMILVAVTAGNRTLVFYLLAGGVGSLVAIQALFTDERDYRTGLYLLEVVLLAAIVRFAALYTTPGLVGIDTWTHIYELVTRIQAADSLGAIGTNKHYASPLFHLLVVETADLADVSLRTALYASVAVVMPVSVLLVYGATNLLVDTRWAVLAALLYSFGNDVIQWGIHVVPTSQGLALYLAVLYLLIRVMQTEYRTRDFAMLVFVSAALVFTHQVSTFIMLVLLGCALVAQVLLALGLFDAPGRSLGKNPVNLVGLIVFDFGLAIFTWSLTPFNQGSFLGLVLSYVHETVTSSAGFLNLAGGSTAGGAAYTPQALPGSEFVRSWLPYLDELGFLLLLLGTFVGSLYVVDRRRTRHPVLTLVVAAAVMLVFVLGLPMFGIRNFIPQRWFAYLYAPLAILSVVGLRHLARSLDGRLFVAGALVVLLAFPTAMAVSSDATIDSPAFPEHQSSLGYTERELAAVESVAEMTGSPSSQNLLQDEVLYTDQPYQTVFNRRGAYPAAPAVVAPNGTLLNSTVTVYRDYQTHGAPYWSFPNDIGRQRQLTAEALREPGDAVVYTNGNVKVFVDSSAPEGDEGGSDDDDDDDGEN